MAYIIFEKYRVIFRQCTEQLVIINQLRKEKLTLQSMHTACTSDKNKAASELKTTQEQLHGKQKEVELFSNKLVDLSAQIENLKKQNKVDFQIEIMDSSRFSFRK